jgi:phosphoserine aminotransferase
MYTDYRAHNFSAGPAGLPTEVLLKAKEELINYRNLGASVMEISHRSKEFSEIVNSAKQRLKRLLGLSDRHKILFLQGGASLQFAMLPQNFLRKGDSAGYINTGEWSQKAIKEAKLFGKTDVPYSSEEQGFNQVPQGDDLNMNLFEENKNWKYLHFTSNNTIYGTQFRKEPQSKTPLVCDASSDFLSRNIDVDRYGLIYAGAQKNLGPSGVCLVVADEEFINQAYTDDVPTLLRYGSHTKKLYHTPTTFSIYMVELVLEWLEDLGGISEVQKMNDVKSGMLYHELDEDDFYTTSVEKESRSQMNVTFRIHDEKLESLFIQEAEKAGMMGLKGHRSAGGLRASLYNAVTMGDAKALVAFMREFRDNCG